MYTRYYWNCFCDYKSNIAINKYSDCHFRKEHVARAGEGWFLWEASKHILQKWKGRRRYHALGTSSSLASDSMQRKWKESEISGIVFHTKKLTSYSCIFPLYWHWYLCVISIFDRTLETFSIILISHSKFRYENRRYRFTTYVTSFEGKQIPIKYSILFYIFKEVTYEGILW